MKPKINCKVLGKIDGEILEISPDNAKYILNNYSRKNNRKISEAVVTNYSNYMKQGEWVISEPIAFDNNGIILNGHHRLHAVIMSKMTVAFNVMYEIEPDAFPAYDGHKGRTAGDTLSIACIPNAAAVAAIASAYWNLKFAYTKNNGEGGSLNTFLKPSKKEILEMVKKHEEIYQAVTNMTSSCKSLCAQSALGQVLIYSIIENGTSIETAKKFF
jgi:hypothetical protein